VQPGATPILDSVTLAYLPQNTPPVVRNITVTTMQVSATASKPAAAQAVSSSYSVTVTDTADGGPATSAGDAYSERMLWEPETVGGHLAGGRSGQ